MANAKSSFPKNKVIASTLAPPLVAVLLHIASSYGIDLPVDVERAIATIATFTLGYMVPDRED